MMERDRNGFLMEKPLPSCLVETHLKIESGCCDGKAKAKGAPMHLTAEGPMARSQWLI